MEQKKTPILPDFFYEQLNTIKEAIIESMRLLVESTGRNTIWIDPEEKQEYSDKYEYEDMYPAENFEVRISSHYIERHCCELIECNVDAIFVKDGRVLLVTDIYEANNNDLVSAYEFDVNKLQWIYSSFHYAHSQEK